MAKTGRVVDYVVDHLAAIGVEFLFGVDGANIEDLYDAAYFNRQVTAVLAKHEFSAVTMADGYSRGTSALGVAMATSGGGALNLVPGLGESLASRVPILVLVGQPPTALDGCGSFQDTSGKNGSLNAEALFAAVSVYCRRITAPVDIVSALPLAVAAARTGGPAVLLLPKDIQQATLPEVRTMLRGDRRPPIQTGDLRPVARALRRTHGPVTIIAGEQVARDDAREELDELRAVLRARVATVPDAKDVSGSPGLGSSSALGVTGVMGHTAVPRAVADSAVCLLVGTRLSVTAGAGLEEALSTVRTISIGSAAPYLPCTHVHTSDLRGYLTLLVRELSGDGRPMGVPGPESPPRVVVSQATKTGAGVGYRDAMSALDAALPDGTDIVVDAGNTGAAAIHHLPVRRGGRFVVALGMGGMGYGFGAGIGMAFGRKRRTVVIAGDGAFFMHGMEVHTALQYQLPVTFVLFNNNAHAMCVTREQLFYDDMYTYNRFRPSHLGSGLAAMFPGLPSVDVSTVAALPDALDDALNVDGPSVVCIACSADEIPPFAPFQAQQQATKRSFPQSNSTSEASTYHATTRA
jgi:acetolactate synthase-1/2/3 large subunit